MQPVRQLEGVEDTTLEEYLHEVDRHLKPYMNKAINKVPKVFPLQEGVEFQINTGGKRLRAALCVTAGAMFCGSMMRAMNFAATIELLQNFMLDHDDIADGDEERRARESIWKKYGIGHAINIGDVFITLSAHSIFDSPYVPRLKLKLIQLLCEYGLEIADGQSLDINLKSNDSPKIEDYIECTKKKTGSFLALATVGGAMIGGAPKRRFHSLYNFATTAGVAFQVKDDLIDITGIKGRTRGSDIKEGKRTLLTIYAAERCSADERKKLYLILNSPREQTSREDIEWTFNLYRKTGAITYAENFAESLIENSLEHLAVIPDSKAKNMLIKISNFISLRTR
jgi:geranylgeranyl diphosphate synthase, type I